MSRRRNRQRGSALRSANGARNTSCVARIPIELPTMTAANYVSVSLDPSVYTSSMCSVLMSIYDKYYVDGVTFEWDSSVGYNTSAGLLGLAYLANEAIPLPASFSELTNMVINGIGKLVPVKANKVIWNVPRGAIRNDTEGYTPGASNTPGRFILGPTTTCDDAAPGTLLMIVKYRLVGPRAPTPPAAPTPPTTLGGTTINIGAADSTVWPVGYAHTDVWNYFEVAARSCFPNNLPLAGQVTYFSHGLTAPGIVQSFPWVGTPTTFRESLSGTFTEVQWDAIAANKLFVVSSVQIVTASVGRASDMKPPIVEIHGDDIALANVALVPRKVIEEYVKTLAGKDVGSLLGWDFDKIPPVGRVQAAIRDYLLTIRKEVADGASPLSFLTESGIILTPDVVPDDGDVERVVAGLEALIRKKKRYMDL